MLTPSRLTAAKRTVRQALGGLCCGAIGTASCWGTGTGLMVHAGSNAGMLIAGEVLVGIGSAFTCAAVYAGCITCGSAYMTQYRQNQVAHQQKNSA